jgi:hypothetical protein
VSPAIPASEINAFICCSPELERNDFSSNRHPALALVGA